MKSLLQKVKELIGIEEAPRTKRAIQQKKSGRNEAATGSSTDGEGMLFLSTNGCGLYSLLR